MSSLNGRLPFLGIPSSIFFWIRILIASTGLMNRCRIFGIFTLLGLFIACLGLLGLASFTAESRTKEIGIRKVCGASVAGIVIMLSKQFTKWVLLANGIAWPVAYFAMNKWLQNFAYRINIDIMTFLLSGLLVLGIALLTVSFQSFKAALANPADSLRYE